MLEMLMDHLLDVHTIHVVRAEHGDDVGVPIVDQVEILIHRICRAFVPSVPCPHLRGDNGHEAAGEAPADLPAVAEMFDK